MYENLYIFHSKNIIVLLNNESNNMFNEHYYQVQVSIPISMVRYNLRTKILNK